MLDIHESDTKLPAINAIAAYLDELRAARPTAAFGQLRSTKGAGTAASILKAARAVFIEHGHAGLTLRKVARAAGLAVGNVNYYFVSKHNLLEAMLREELTDYVEEHIKQFEAAHEAPLEILLNVVTFYVANGRRSHRFFYQMWGYAGSDPAAMALIRDLYRPIGRFILCLVKAANPALEDIEARRIVLQLFSLEEGVKLFMGMGPEDDAALRTAERDIRDLARRIIEGT